MSSHFKKINRNLIIGWFIIVAVLLISYIAEVIKGERTVEYLLAFIPVTVLPAIVVFILYLKKSDWEKLPYFIVIGYFLMYTFVMVTGYSSMVSTYILPMLSLMVLYHQPKLVLMTGVASLILNAVTIVWRFSDGRLTIENSADAEIQIALMVLCFGGSYVAARLYDNITKQNLNYLKKLNEKNEQINRMTMQTISTIANTLDAKDTYTNGHSERVSTYATMIAKELGLSDEEVDNICLVALLHDIGKVGVPDSVLNKPGRLTDEEFELMKQHTVAGSEIMKDIDSIPDVTVGARYHHERYDGRGYPDGLQGDDIPLIARIIAVADAYDAMTSNRVYRQHLTGEQVMAELEKGTGTQFDPAISRIMIRMMKDGTMKNLSPDMKNEAG
ncbi:MAG: HD-GYP domain-containing protein [Eubacterium sp.]|nr:HD-GYP domain-containing protein [Eubacterium sp.]